ncbi:MAG: DegT/DnrJ/EryC1/StrS family aminotransferase [Planctomyces sp.]|nr:DegT/DnrJ/EryC1/StrS family aminotransferase [Planctomyces sp.]
MREKFLSFSLPFVGQEEIDEVVEALRSGWLTSGPRTRQFEQEFRQYTGSPGALALNSCTAGLHVALKVLNIGPGDEVITTPITFAASVNVIEHVGATPVLADVEPDTLNIDPVQVEKAITPATRAIIAVHYAGHPVELNAIRNIASQHRLHLIEDAAHAVGAEFHGEPIGCGDNFTAFSFYATKNLTTGEGGMLTGNQELLDRARIVSLHGMNREAWSRYAAGGKWAYDIVEPGFKYNMTDIQAALGLQQLRRFSWMQERRAQIVQQYNQAFQSAAFITPVTRDSVRNAHHLYVLRIREGELSIDRNQFIDEMTARNIGTSVHFIPIHMHSFYKNKYGYTPNSFPVAHGAFQQMLSLPLSPSMSDQDVCDVIEAVLDIRSKFARRRMAA